MLPDDPFSPAYAAEQWSLYRQVSGRAGYSATASEQSKFDLESLVQRPFPYYTMSCETVGNQLVMQGLVIKHLGLRPESEVLEFGPGNGDLALSLALMGNQVTAVDISPDFIELIRRRAQQLGLAITLVCDNMLAFESDKTYDAVVFFESFHHCAEHLEMLKRLHRLVKADGVVVFGFEPITRTADSWGSYPWGIRLDGMSVWSARNFGWLELGFTEGYFLEALHRTGWQGTVTRFDTPVFGTIVVARKQ
jgi:SAM-dependent methyltransferase